MFQPAASLFMDFIGHFSLSLPSAPPLDPTRHDRLPAVAHMHLLVLHHDPLRALGLQLLERQTPD